MSKLPEREVSIIIVSWNTVGLLRNCLNSIYDNYNGSGGMQVVVVDNGSSDGSAEMVGLEFPRTSLIRNDHNLGFAKASNQGIRASNSRYILLLNSDTIVKKNTIERLVQFMREEPDAGVCGARLLLPTGQTQPYLFGSDPTIPYLLKRAFYRFFMHRPMHDWNTENPQEVDWASGACLIVRQDAIDTAGLLDENFFMYFEDSDWCLRMRRQGWKVYYNPRAGVVHFGGQSLLKNPKAKVSYYRSLSYFYRKHYGLLACSLLNLILGPYRLFLRHRHAHRN
jgi:GT2 family glycosyltransferase